MNNFCPSLLRWTGQIAKSTTPAHAQPNDQSCVSKSKSATLQKGSKQAKNVSFFDFGTKDGSFRFQKKYHPRASDVFSHQLKGFFIPPRTSCPKSQNTTLFAIFDRKTGHFDQGQVHPQKASNVYLHQRRGFFDRVKTE